MEKFNVKKIENAILTDCPDDAIQEVIETADIPIYGQLLLDVNNNDSFLHFSFRARDCNIVYSFDVIGFTISPVAENDETEYSFETSDGTYTFVCIKTKQALDALVKLGVVSESLKHESLMSEEDYAKTISDLARNPQARAEFASLSNSDAGQNNFTTYLTDSYEDACQYDWNPYLVLNKTEYGLADVVMSAIETRLNNGHDSIDLAKLQRLTGKSSQEASNIMVELERMGIVEGENDKKILVSSDDIAHLKEVALQHEMSHDMGTLEYAEAITELVMETIEKGSISVDDIIINPSMAEKNVNASSAIHTLEELGVISGDDAHTCLVTQEEYAQKFKEGNSDAFTNLLAISYAEYTREEKADRDEFVTEKADSKEEISSPTEPEHDEIPEMPPFDEHDPYEDYPEQEDTAFAPNYPSDELPEDPYSGVEDNFHFENMPEPPEEPDMNNDLDMSLD